MVAHEPAERRTHKELALEPAGDPALDADRALVAKEGAAIEVPKHEPVLQQVERSLHALEPDLLGFAEGHPFDGAIYLLSAPERGNDGMELDELAVALIFQHGRRAAIVLPRAERSQHLERQPAIGVNMELDRLQANRDDHRSATRARSGVAPARPFTSTASCRTGRGRGCPARPGGRSGRSCIAKPRSSCRASLDRKSGV